MQTIDGRIIRNATIAPDSVQPGANGQVLTTAGGAAEWAAPAPASIGITDDSGDSLMGITAIKFIGATVALDGGTANQADVTIAGGGGSSAIGKAITMGSVPYSLTNAYALVQPSGGAPFALQIPSSGSYMITAVIDVSDTTAGDAISFQIYDTLAAAYVPNTIFPASVPTAGGQGQGVIQFPYAASGPTTLQVWGVNATAARGTVVANTPRIDYLTVSSESTYPLPNISSFSPTYGTSVSLTLTGSGFTGATLVKINGTSCTSVTVVSDTQITCTTPATFTTGPITVTTPGGTATSSANFSPIASKSIQSITTTSLDLLLAMFEGTGTSTSDGSPHGLSYTLSTGCSWTTDGGGLPAIQLSSINTSAQVYGADTYLPSGGTGRTIAVKFLVPSTSTAQTIFSYGTNTLDEGLNIGVNSGGTMHIGWQGGSATSTVTISTNTWYVFVLTYSASSITGYLNGTSIMTGSTTLSTVLSGQAAIGYNAAELGVNEGQTIDYLGIWSRVLSGTEISALV